MGSCEGQNEKPQTDIEEKSMIDFDELTRPQKELEESELRINERHEFVAFCKELEPLIKMKWDAWRVGLRTGDLHNTMSFVIPNLPPHTDVTSVRMAPGLQIDISVTVSQTRQ